MSILNTKVVHEQGKVITLVKWNQSPLKIICCMCKSQGRNQVLP